MEAGLDLFTGGSCGGGISSGGSTNGSLSTISKAEVVEQDYVGLSSEASSYAVESELDLGLGLSLGSGSAGVKATKVGAWGEYGRILIAKDFPSIMPTGGTGSAASSSSSSGKANTPVSGTKRAADSIAQEGGSAQGVSQVVGWPPIRSYRINSLVNQTKVQAEGDKKASDGGKLNENMNMKTDNSNKTVNALEKGYLGKSLFVKVNMDGIPFGRKVDLSVHASYETLSKTLEDMFMPTTTTTNSIRMSEDKEHGIEARKPSKLLDGSDFVLTYEDKDGDWMLVGDVPWGMFIGTVKRLRIMKKSEANGLAPRFQQSCSRQRTKPI